MLHTPPRHAVLACVVLMSIGCAGATPAAAPKTAARGGPASDAPPLATKAPAVPEVTSIEVAGSKLNRTRAVVIVDAPMDAVRRALFDFAHYHEFMPGYRPSRIIGPTPGGGHEVDMRVEELGGLIKLTLRVEIMAPVIANGQETYDGRLISGNVKLFQSRWQIEPAPGGATRLLIESLLDPDLPLPATFINSGSIGRLRDAILALKARAEGR